MSLIERVLFIKLLRLALSIALVTFKLYDISQTVSASVIRCKMEK